VEAKNGGTSGAAAAIEVVGRTEAGGGLAGEVCTEDLAVVVGFSIDGAAMEPTCEERNLARTDVNNAPLAARSIIRFACNKELTYLSFSKS
jgi:hypothetical protein